MRRHKLILWTGVGPLRWRSSKLRPCAHGAWASAGESLICAIGPRVNARMGVHLGALRNEGLAEATTETCNFLMILEAPPGFEPGMEVLQTSALPLGDGAVEDARFGST
jgi:hypothetical protein